jgi:hypothetical protein
MIAATEVEFMTTEDVSTELGIPVGTLRYYRSEVMAWVEDQERSTRRGEGVE